MTARRRSHELQETEQLRGQEACQEADSTEEQLLIKEKEVLSNERLEYRLGRRDALPKL
jgi:hypothetical protein